MVTSADDLLDEMAGTVRAWMSGTLIDVAAEHRSAIEAVGAVPLLARVFRHFGDTTLTGWLLCLAPVWKDLPFSGWKEILDRVYGDTKALYQFVPFATEYLGIDIMLLVYQNTAIELSARQFLAGQFPMGGPPPGSNWVREVLAANGIDQHQLLRRLVAEGAPAKARPERERPNH